MTRRLFFLPVALLTVFAGYLGWRLGQPVSETQIINRYAQWYVQIAPEGAQVSDCAARSGEGPVRMIVTCVHADGTPYSWVLDGDGEILNGDVSEGPQA